MTAVHKIKIPHGAENILKKLHDNGYEAYVVGGCVRDSLLGLIPNDWDICTSSSPEKVEEILSELDCRIVETGLKHGTVTAVLPDGDYEVTTFRRDGEYRDNRRPESVEFVSDLKEDLSRRDFTINAMAYSDETGVIDCFGGINDLEKRE